MEHTTILFGIAAAAALAIRLFWSGLLSRYRSLFFFCVFTVGRTVLSYGRPQNTDSYFLLWAFTEPLSWILYVLLVLDVYSSIFEQFPALAKLGRSIFKWGLTLSVVGSLGFTLWTVPPDGPFPVYAALLVTQRVVLSSLILFTIVLLSALVWLRVPLRRNTVVFASVFFIYFLAKAGLILLYQTLGPDIRPSVNLFLALVADFCFVAWTVGLSPAGEGDSVRVGYRWNAVQGDKLIEQLTAINDTLSRSRK